MEIKVDIVTGFTKNTKKIANTIQNNVSGNIIVAEEENEFVPAMLMMSCCAAHLVPVGLLAHYD